MSTVMLGPRNESPKQLAETQFRRLVELDVNVPTPDVIQVGKVRVSIADVLPSINAYRSQRDLLLRFAISPPMVLLHAPGDHQLFAVPFDIRDGLGKQRSLGSLSTRTAVEDTVAHAVVAAHDANLSVVETTPAQTDAAFAGGISQSFGMRIAAGFVGGAAPPDDVFSVITDSNGVQIMFATGFFVSTQQGFGFSSPATRRLPWGGYTFGYSIGGNVTFDNTLWTVPENSSINLHV